MCFPKFIFRELGHWNRKAWSSMVQVDRSFTTWGSTRHFCTAFATVVWKAERWKPLVADRLIGTGHQHYFAVHSLFRCTFCITKAFHICILYLGQDNRNLFAYCTSKADWWARQNPLPPREEVFFHTDLLASPLEVSSPSALAIGVATPSSAVFNEWHEIGGSPTVVEVLHVVATQRRWSRIPSGLLVTAMCTSR